MSDFVFALQVVYPTKGGTDKRTFYFTDRKEAEYFRRAVQGENSRVKELVGFLPETSKSALDKLRMAIKLGRQDASQSNRIY